jgi:hypothetical protein
VPEVNKLSVDDYFKYVAELMKTNPHREATALPLRSESFDLLLFAPPVASYASKRDQFSHNWKSPLRRICALPATALSLAQGMRLQR